MNVLITGAGGFIGAKLTEYLAKHNFHIYALTSNKNNIKEIKEKKKGYKEPEPEQEKWQKLPDNFRYVTAESVYFDLLMAESDAKTEYEMTDRDWIAELHSGNIQNVPDKISPEELSLIHI